MRKANKTKTVEKEAEALNKSASEPDGSQENLEPDAEAENQEQEVTTTQDELNAAVNAANEKYLRSKAELENYRKRMQREFAELRQHVKILTIQEFLPVFDHFQMALQHAEEGSNESSLLQGMEMIYTEFKRTFERLGIVPIESVGKPFDPNEHEAMSQEPSADVEEGHVIREWKTGFRIGEKLLRPATVVVSAGPKEVSESGSNTAKNSE